MIRQIMKIEQKTQIKNVFSIFKLRLNTKIRQYKLLGFQPLIMYFSLFRTNAVHLKFTSALEYRFNNPDLQGLTSL